MHSELCPVCKGKGKIPNDLSEGSTTAPYEKTCHACNGVGYILVPDEHPYWPEPYYPPQPYYPPFYIDPNYIDPNIVWCFLW